MSLGELPFSLTFLQIWLFSGKKKQLKKMFLMKIFRLTSNEWVIFSCPSLLLWHNNIWRNQWNAWIAIDQNQIEREMISLGASVKLAVSIKGNFRRTRAERIFSHIVFQSRGDQETIYKNRKIFKTGLVTHNRPMSRMKGKWELDKLLWSTERER